MLYHTDGHRLRHYHAHRAAITRPLLNLLHTPESIIDWCQAYLTIIFVGIAGCGLYNILSGVLRGLGDSVSALIYLLVATFLNNVLDYVFVAKLSMGVAGVAWATIIAQFVSAVLSLRKLSRMKSVFDLKREYLRPEKSTVSRSSGWGFPMWISVVTSVALRIPLAYGLVYLTKTPVLPTGECSMMYVSMLTTWTLGAVITFIMYQRGKWQNLSMVSR